jgi:S1-C subfamily serine protease
MPDKSASALLLALSTELAGLIRDVGPSLISIQSGRARSSGFVWRPGLIVAAEDALADEGEFSIVAHDGVSSPARVVGRDPSTDVAVLRVERTDLPNAPPAAAGPAAGSLVVVAGAREGAANAALEHRTVRLNRGGFRRGGECDSLPDWR